MKNLTIKSLIDFRRKRTEASKKLFLANLQKEKEEIEETEEGEKKGGNYWVTSLSAIGNTYRHDNVEFINEKIKELQDRHDKSQRSQSQSMYKKNIKVLTNFEDFDWGSWKPTGKLTFLPKGNSILPIKGLTVKALPNYVFSFGNGDEKELGAIWFVAKQKGYTRDELGMHTEMLYRYLKMNFGGKFTINQDHILAVDVIERSDVSYSQLEKGDIQRILIPTVNEIIKMM